MLTRRHFIAGAAGLAGTAMLLAGRRPVYGQSLGPAAIPTDQPAVPLALVAAERPVALPAFGGHTLPLWTFADAWLPIVRVPFGAALEVDLRNELPRPGEHASIHWHGIRLPNDQDGVPYLVQPPVFPGDSHRYVFRPPDTGTFFFHTHCNTAEHLGRGLVGVLLVTGDESEPYDADEVLLLRDWRVDLATGGFQGFTSNRGAARAGTFGAVRSVNGAVDPAITLPARADCRLRLLNVDPSRISDVGIAGAEAAVVAIDGIAVPPFPLDRWTLAPAMRIDVVLRTPAEGGTAELIDYRGETPLRLATLRAAGPARRGGGFLPAPLRAGHIPEPDLRAAETIEFTVASSGEGDRQPEPIPGFPELDILCGASNDFWTINATGWPEGMAQIPQPLARLRLGASYRVLLRNPSQFLHPIHIHGHSLIVFGSNQRPIVRHAADTVLLHPDEIVEAAFVADNPGSWMLHCHVAEHQETGMMGWFSVA